jgi:hypothetical protein
MNRQVSQWWDGKRWGGMRREGMGSDGDAMGRDRPPGAIRPKDLLASLNVARRHQHLPKMGCDGRQMSISRTHHRGQHLPFRASMLCTYRHPRRELAHSLVARFGLDEAEHRVVALALAWIVGHRAHACHTTIHHDPNVGLMSRDTSLYLRWQGHCSSTEVRCSSDGCGTAGAVRQLQSCEGGVPWAV